MVCLRRRTGAGIVRRVLFLVFVLFALGGLAFCLSQLIPKLLEYRHSTDAFTEIADTGISDYDPADRLIAGDAEAADVSDALTIDWDAYAGTEIVAWFQMDGLSYPIMQHVDNAYYLDHLPDGSYNAGGSLFLLNHNNPLFTDRSSFIYGHNMNNKTMFGSLKDYTTEQSKDHVFYLYLPDGTRHVYQFFSVATVFQESRAYTWSFESNDTFLAWQDWMLKESMVSTSLQKSEDAKFVTLSTCNGYSGTNHRLIVCGQEVRVDKLQNPASWYDAYLQKYNEESAAKRARLADIRADLSGVQASARKSIYDSQTR